MDLASVIGLAGSWFFMIISILISAKFDMGMALKMIDAASVMIVIGGTFGATLVSTQLPKAISGFKAIGKIFKLSETEPGSAIAGIIELANLARKEGLLALEEAVQSLEDPFLKKGIMLIVDGTDPELVRSIMETELAYQEQRHAESRGVWDTVGSMAPAWGMIGTLIGLVMMLQNLSDPTTIGPSMAVALLTTFYGSVVANSIAIPASKKMKQMSTDELLVKEILIEGMLSIQAGENPRIIEEKLKAFLSPVMRSGIGDDGGDE